MKNYLVTEFKRAVVSYNFLYTIGFVLLIYCIGIISEINEFSDILSIYQLTNDSSFTFLIFLACTLPYSMSFCSDMENNFIQPVILRSSISSYCYSKIAVCFIAAFLAIFAASIIFCLSLVPFIQVDIKNGSNFYYYVKSTLGGALLMDGHYLLYFVIYFILNSISAGFWSIVALYVSTKITNKFVTLTAPFIIYYLMLLIMRDIPIYLRLNKLVEGKFLIHNTAMGLFYIITLFGFLSVSLAYLFKKSVERRLNNG